MEGRAAEDVPCCDLEAHVTRRLWPQVARVHRFGPRDAKVDELDASVRGEQDVAGLDVAVGDVEAVDVNEGGEDLIHDRFEKGYKAG